MSKVLFVSLGTPEPSQVDALQSYATTAPPLLVAAGAQPRFRARRVEQLVGSAAPETLFVAEFPSVEVAKAAFAQPDYQALVPLRDKAFRKLDFFLAEEF